MAGAGEERAEPRHATRSRENTRARLLEAAAQVFAEVGLGEASVEAVCDRAGFTRGAFYSNFASKDELFLELAIGVAHERVDAVRRRVSDMLAAWAGSEEPIDATALVEVLAVEDDDRFSTMLMSEIHNRAMRDEKLAEASLAEERRMVDEVAQIIDDIVTAKGLTLRLPSPEVARVLLATWEDVSVRGAIGRVPAAELNRMRGDEVGRLAALLIG